MDLLNGVVVQAVRGRRSEYRPVRSQLTESVDPSVVLRCLSDLCRSNVAYVADLDAILRQEPNRCTLAELSRLPVQLMVDAGVRNSADAQELFDIGVDQIIVGLETLAGPSAAIELIETFTAESLIFSVDLKFGKPMSTWEPWAHLSAEQLVDELIPLGFQRWIVLDLLAVGSADGVPTLELCQHLRNQCPDDEIITGGGIRGHSDLQQLETASVDGVLVASALHSGAISSFE